MNGKQMFEAIDREIIRAGGTDRITFLPIAPELVEQLVGQRVEVVGVQQETGRLPKLLLREPEAGVVDEVAGEMARLIGPASNGLVCEWARRLHAA